MIDDNAEHWKAGNEPTTQNITTCTFIGTGYRNPSPCIKKKIITMTIIILMIIIIINTVIITTIIIITRIIIKFSYSNK